MAKVVETNIDKSYIVNDNGETVSTELKYTTKLRRTESEPPYVKMYLERLGDLKKLNGKECSIMREILYMMSYKTNTLYIINHTRKIIADNCDTTDGVVKKSLTKFIKQGIMTRISTGTYSVNPNYFGKGSWNDIKKLRLTLEFSEDGETMVLEEIKK